MSEPRPTLIAIDQLFATLETLTEADLVALSGVWMGGDADLRREAWAQVGSVARDDPRAQALERARDRLASWVNDLGITWAGAYEKSIVVPTGADQGNLRRNAVPAILDGIAATLFDELLTTDQQDELLAPWRHVTDLEAAPEAADG
jgi:hypothetical protein